MPAEDRMKTVYKDFISKAKTEKEKEMIKKAYAKAVSDFTRAVTRELDFSCPKGWIQCADGSCAPPGSSCPE